MFTNRRSRRRIIFLEEINIEEKTAVSVQEKNKVFGRDLLTTGIDELFQ